MTKHLAHLIKKLCAFNFIQFPTIPVTNLLWIRMMQQNMLGLIIQDRLSSLGLLTDEELAEHCSFSKLVDLFAS